MNRNLEEKIRQVQQGLDNSYHISKTSIPFEVMAQKTPQELADRLRVVSMKRTKVWETLYCKNPYHFVQIVTDREKVAHQIEQCQTIEEARKVLMDSGIFK